MHNIVLIIIVVVHLIYIFFAKEFRQYYYNVKYYPTQHNNKNIKHEFKFCGFTRPINWDYCIYIVKDLCAV